VESAKMVGVHISEVAAVLGLLVVVVVVVVVFVAVVGGMTIKCRKFNLSLYCSSLANFVEPEDKLMQ
jgi:hypothetical protein